MSNEADDNYDGDDDDETLSERCGTDVQLLWSGYDCRPVLSHSIPSRPDPSRFLPARVGCLHWCQRKAQLFICTMSEKCQAGAKGPKDSSSSSSCMALQRLGLKR